MAGSEFNFDLKTANFDIDFEKYVVLHKSIADVSYNTDDNQIHVKYQDGTDHAIGDPIGQHAEDCLTGCQTSEAKSKYYENLTKGYKDEMLPWYNSVKTWRDEVNIAREEVAAANRRIQGAVNIEADVTASTQAATTATTAKDEALSYKISADRFRAEAALHDIGGTQSYTKADGSSEVITNELEEWTDIEGTTTNIDPSAKTFATLAKANAEKAKTSAEQAEAFQQSAQRSEQMAKNSENAAKTSEDNAADSARNAAQAKTDVFDYYARISNAGALNSFTGPTTETVIDEDTGEETEIDVDGTQGLVPAPEAKDKDKFLRTNGWTTLQANMINYGESDVSSVLDNNEDKITTLETVASDLQDNLPPKIFYAEAKAGNAKEPNMPEDFVPVEKMIWLKPKNASTSSGEGT